MIGVIRRCRRCDQWRSIDRFVELGRLCKDCTASPAAPTDRIALTRGYALTDKARAAIREAVPA